MATNYRTSAGTDFDDVFDPYVQGTVPPNTAYRTSDGVDLAGRYAPLSYGSKAPDVNYRTSDGTDVTNLWAAKGTAVYSLGFNGQTYVVNAAATTLHGSSEAELSLVLSADGTWSITKSVNHGGPGVIASGTWLPSGASAANYSVMYAYTTSNTSAAFSVSNDATSYVALSTSRNISVSIGGSSDEPESANGTITCYLRPASGTASHSTLSFNLSAH